MARPVSASGSARVLVQVRPEALDEAERQIAAIPGVEVCDRDRSGKMALRLRYAGTGNLAAMLRKVSLVPGVTAATLAMQAEPFCGSVD